MTVLATDSADRIVDGPDGYTGVEGDAAWAAEVRRLLICAAPRCWRTNYQLPEIQDVADHVGDSLALSRIAAEAPEDTIVFAGVHFMARPPKILSPDKTVLIPDQRAGCSLADSITAGRAPCLEGRASRRRGRVLRQHHGRGEGRDRHLLHVLQCRRGGRIDPRRPRGAVLPGSVPGCPRASDDGPAESARLGGECHVHAGIKR